MGDKKLEKILAKALAEKEAEKNQAELRRSETSDTSRPKRKLNLKKAQSDQRHDRPKGSPEILVRSNSEPDPRPKVREKIRRRLSMSDRLRKWQRQHGARGWC